MVLSCVHANDIPNVTAAVNERVSKDCTEVTPISIRGASLVLARSKFGPASSSYVLSGALRGQCVDTKILNRTAKFVERSSLSSHPTIARI